MYLKSSRDVERFVGTNFVNRVPSSRSIQWLNGKVFGAAARPRTPLNISLSDTGETWPWEGRNISSLFSRCQAQLQLVIRISVPDPYFNIRPRRRVSPEIHFTLYKLNDDEYTYGNSTRGINVVPPGQTVHSSTFSLRFHV